MNSNKTLLKFVSIFTLCLCGAMFALTGCSNVFESKSDNAGEYGSLVWNDDSGASLARALNVGDIKTARITVSGYRMADVSSDAVITVSNGTGSAEVKNIPVGKNRIVTVTGYSDSGATMPVEEAVLRAVVDINPGVNTISEINWETSRKGYVYNALLRDGGGWGYDISSLSSDQIAAIDNAIPNVDATNINLELFVRDFNKGNGTLKEFSAYILNPEKTLKRLVVCESDNSTESAPCFTATAHYSDGNNDVTSDSGTVWISSDESVATVSGGKVTLKAAGTTVVTATYSYDGIEKTGAKQTITVKAGGTGLAIYVLATYDEVKGGAGHIYEFKESSSSNKQELFGGFPGSALINKLTDDKKAYYYIFDDNILSKIGKIIINNGKNSNAGGKQTSDLVLPETSGHWLAYYNTEKSSWDWKEYTEGNTVSLPGSGGTLTATINSEVVTEPFPPTVKITPANGDVSTTGTITVSYEENNATVTDATVTLGGEVSKSYSLTNFSNGKLNIKVSELGITEAGKTITVFASVTNSEGTTKENANLTTVLKAQVPDTFTWDNANVYFVIQDRFFDGDPSNNNSYGRMSKDELGKTIGTFHGGDIKGLTQKLDYLDKLGVNAIWITAPYEQAHGWCGGGSNGDFAHYAYHGYYPLDYTMMDKNMGTVEEFRAFVTEAHSRGIRVVMDVVMNHTGYFTLQDMQDYSIYPIKTKFKGYNTSAIRDLGYTFSGTGDSTYHKYHDYLAYKDGDTGASEWLKWWGPSWIRAGVPGYTAGGTDDLTKNLDSLPDVKTENKTAQKVAPLLQTKWSKETSGYDSWIVPAAKSLRSTSAENEPAVWIEKWLASWVEEFGIDGFRCDTAKHVDKYRWNELKNLCKIALVEWRKSNRADEYAKGWDEEFWMTGESFGWRNGGDSSWFNNGFDSMIDFSVAGGDGMQNYQPNLPDWNNRLGNKQALLYISSHDTGLGRSSNQIELGTSFVLMPGLIQIYYGDETSRAFGDTGSDKNQGTRSDFNWEDAKGACATHWGKVGTFRKYNPAVGAGTGSATKRTYKGSAGESKVAIGISGTSVDVSGLFDSGTTVYNWYDGTSASVSGGSVSFAGGTRSQPILVSDKNPADYGVTF